MMESDHTNEKNRVIMRIVTEETVDELRAVGGFFILHRAILVSSDMRYARKVKLSFIVSTISR